VIRRPIQLPDAKPSWSEKFMAWSFIICAFAWMPVPPVGFAIGFMFLTLGLIYLRSVSRRERKWREEPIHPREPMAPKGRHGSS
jgi:hypothetical protein